MLLYRLSFKSSAKREKVQTTPESHHTATIDISPRHLSYPGSERGSNKGIKEKSVTEPGDTTYTVQSLNKTKVMPSPKNVGGKLKRKKNVL